ncbi:hypothetical protein MHAS_01871 [Mycolicibacterium hassiacum DSM 44199]|jgi:hypothetical protein|uniref:hypothetical protein n=1 Tax=Mycolicibacterium hassiacum TaxID=46351 RepID=UPI0003635EDC|nr:hypothetical protein [Mycolicibacterium hassiacum]MBX5487424.1 hypothetical protein [Mycolicibacterium hassiacum]MDA4088627.1 hypothetical protein [Mycolicibacterium hassiacum DSM 44199]PZN25475.1 MAG: hypothetical protein DIU75_00380 [Mycolicibacterium hassiacum]VCT90167.1 hypothetical protein MHAS_01871 [Mycolicibacterium hassiacum DSM 44199]
MNLPDTPQDLRDRVPSGGVFGTPYQTADGTTVIPVTRAGGGPLGIFTVRAGSAKWVPAVDATRIVLVSLLIGLVTSVFAGVAMIRRPPWPDLRGDISGHPAWRER